MRIGYSPVVAMVAAILISAGTVFAQEVDFTPSKERASELFAALNYTEALRHYEALSEKFPADPLYKYYSGVCMVMTGEKPEVSSRLLGEACRLGSQLRPVPDDVRFYLGRSYQQSGRFSEAVQQYELFRENATRREIKNLNIDKYIDECSSGMGAIAVEQPVIERNAAVEEVKTDLPEVIAAVEPEEDIKPVDQNYDLIAREALVLQFRADSVTRLADRYRSRLKDLTGNERESIVKKILQLEQLGFDYQAAADSKFAIASGVTGRGVSNETINEPATTGVKPVADSIVPLVADTAGMQKSDLEATEATQLITPVADPVVVPVVREPVLVIFTTDYPDESGIEVNPELPAGMYYRIQVAAFRNPVKPGYFKSLGPVYGIKATDSDITFYFIGLFRSKSDADRALPKVRAEGFNDAFVVAVNEGIRISLERAASLEKEWAGKSLETGINLTTTTTDAVAEPVEPPTLVYRIEVKKVAKPLPPEEVNNIRKLAGNRPYDIITTSDKKLVYLIGKFITFESAASYSDLLYRNGMKDARVVAYLGDREIPLEKAKELFDLYFNKQ